MQAGDLRVVEVEQAQALAAGGAGGARAHRADVEGVGAQRVDEGEVVELGVVGGGEDHAAAIGPHRGHRVVGHLGGDLHSGKRPAVAILGARFAERDAVVEGERELGEIGGELAGADDQHAPARPECGGELGVVEHHRAVGGGVEQLHGASGEVHPAGEQFSALDAGEGLGEPAAGVQRLEHQAERSAAGQLEAPGLVGGDAVGDDLGALELLRAQAVAEVVLDAAARHRAGEPAIAADRQQRPFRPRRGAPGAHHGGERDRQAGRLPGDGFSQGLEIDAVHVGSSGAERLGR